MSKSARSLLCVAVGTALLLPACANRSTPTAPKSSASSTATSSAQATTSAPATKSEAPIAPETNPPGDIPDNQVFVAYAPPGAAFRLKVPEGWSRSKSADSVSFTDKLNTIVAAWTTTASAPTAASVRSSDVPSLSTKLPAFQLVAVKPMTLPGGNVVLLTYRQNSEPNAVTGKRYRLEVSRYIFFRNGKRIDLVLSSPVGADNVDPWRTVSQSLRWK